MSAPRSSGRWRSGVANVESTTVMAPRSRAPAAMAGISATTMSGFAIDSTQTMSAPSAAARIAAVSSAAAVRRVRRPCAGHPLEDVSDAVVGHRGENDRPAGRDEIGDRGRRGEPGCERHRRAAFERAERRLERAPCRIPVPAVLEARVVAVRRAQDERRVHRRAGDALRPAGLHGDRVGRTTRDRSSAAQGTAARSRHVLISASGAPRIDSRR